MHSLDRSKREFRLAGIAGIVGAGLVTFALSGCGGSVLGPSGAGGDDDDGTDDGGPGHHGGSRDAGYTDPDCPSTVVAQTSCSESGQVCLGSTKMVDHCGVTTQPTCFCDGRSWTCTQPDESDCGTTTTGPTTSYCDGQTPIGDGDVCETPGVTCPSIVPGGRCANGGQLAEFCKCSAGKWSCTVKGCTTPATGCPAPDSVHPGGYCAPGSGSCNTSNQGYFDCTGNYQYVGLELCNCVGSQWQCPEPVPPPCAPPPCPPPTYVSAYAPCMGYGLRCSGNPQACGGDVYFDAFECNGTWTPIATTVCNAYGYADASVSYDGGYYEDGGF